MDWDALWRSNRSDVLSRGPSARARLRVMRRLLERHARGARSLADVGCGTGLLLQEAAALGWFDRLTGVDISEVPLQDARAALPRAEFRVHDICAAPLPERFDVVTSMMTLDLVPDEERAAANLAAMLAPGGRLIAVVQHDERHRTDLDDRYGVRRHSRATLTALLGRHGLQPVDVFAWGWPFYNLYYRAMGSSGVGVVGARSVPTAGLRAGTLALSALFRVDDFLTVSGRGRVLFGVFRR
jgi:SAM-dependent methyltransferase